MNANHLQKSSFLQNELKGGFHAKSTIPNSARAKTPGLDHDGRPISSYYNTLSLLSGCARCIQGSVGNSRSFLGENFGVGYLAIGLGIFFFCQSTSPFPATEPSGSENRMRSRSIQFCLGFDDVYLRTCGGHSLYSLCEWVLYANDPHLAEMGSIQDWASTYPLFHWGPIPWGFYVVLAAALASCFMCAAAINRNTPKPAARSRKTHRRACRNPD